MGVMIDGESGKTCFARYVNSLQSIQILTKHCLLKQVDFHCDFIIIIIIISREDNTPKLATTSSMSRYLQDALENYHRQNLLDGG